jgi:ribonuclease D
MNPVIVIQNPAELLKLVKKLSTAQYIAIDTEANSFYAYFERICLIQISTAEDDYILDPLQLEDLQPLGEILNNPDIEKVFHAAVNDVLGLKRDFRFAFRNLFDTAEAAKLLGYTQLGLAKLLQEHFGVILNKKWQRHNWGKRPLEEEQLDYARMDTHYLIDLRHRLAEGLKARELWDAARESFARASEQEAQTKTFRPESFIQINGARTLDPTGKRILKALYLYREHEARRRNRAPFRVLSNDTLLRIAHQRPKDLKDFSRIKGMPRNYHNGRGAQNLLELIRNIEE